MSRICLHAANPTQTLSSVCAREPLAFSDLAQLFVLIAFFRRRLCRSTLAYAYKDVIIFFSRRFSCGRQVSAATQRGTTVNASETRAAPALEMFGRLSSVTGGQRREKHRNRAYLHFERCKREATHFQRSLRRLIPPRIALLLLRDSFPSLIFEHPRSFIEIVFLLGDPSSRHSFQLNLVVARR